MDGSAALGRRQAALAELGRRALAPSQLGVILQYAVELVARTLEVEHATVMELAPDGQDVRLRAGVGWEEREVGHRVDAIPGGHLAFTLGADAPVIVDDLLSERRFTASPVLIEAGIRGSLAVRIPGPGPRPYGVLAVHTAEARRFDGAEADFLSGVGNVLASVIQRHRQAVEINDEIIQTLVVARYTLQGGRADEAGALLDEALARTRAIVSELLGDGSEDAAGATLPGDLRRDSAVHVRRR